MDYILYCTIATSLNKTDRPAVHRDTAVNNISRSLLFTEHQNDNIILTGDIKSARTWTTIIACTVFTHPLLRH